MRRGTTHRSQGRFSQTKPLTGPRDCGPAVAIARAPDGPALVASDEWELAAEDGHICVSARRVRAQEFARTPTGVRGEIVDGGVTW